jgi:hypothetical protein
VPKSLEASPFGRAQGEGLVNVKPTNPTVKRTGRPYEKDVLAWVPVFLDAIAEGKSVTSAAKRAKVHPTVVHGKRRKDPAFRSAWCEAAEIGTRLMEQEAQRRAYHGVLKPVFYKGVKCASVREYSDNLLMFLLKGRKPQVYREGAEDSVRRSVQINVVNVAGPAQPVPVPAPGIAVEVLNVGANP